MRRLQVGGMALIIKAGLNDLNVGKTVVIKEYFASKSTKEGGFLIGAWSCFSEEGLYTVSGELTNIACFESHRLMPLGDKQTQDELAKEREIEFN